MQVNKINNFSNFKNANQNNQTKTNQLEQIANSCGFIGTVSFFPAVLLKNPTAQKTVAGFGIASNLISGGINSYLFNKQLDTYDSTPEKKAKLYQTTSNIIGDFSIASTLALFTATTRKDFKTGSFAEYALLGITTAGIVIHKILEHKAKKIKNSLVKNEE